MVHRVVDSSLEKLATGSAQLADRNISMLLWAVSSLPDLSLAWTLLHASKASGRHLDGVGLGAMAMACQHRHLYLPRIRILQEYLSSGGAICAIAANASAALWAEVGKADEALRTLRAAARDGATNSVTQQLWLACGGSQEELPPSRSGRAVEPREAYAKELRLLEHVFQKAHRGDLQSICVAVEDFGAHTLPGTKHWLKVAGGVKSKILMAAAKRAPVGGLVVEIGTYCGYSAARLAAARAAEDPSKTYDPRVVTLEVDLAHAAIAQNLLMFAGVSHMVEVLIGHSEDVLPWLVARLRERSRSPIVDVVFLDQRGSRYSADLDVLGGSLREGAVVIADNVLKPGAPVFLWRVSTAGDFATAVISVPEFAMSDVEDWMTVSTYHPGRSASTSSAVPDSIRVLEQRAQQMRARAHQPDHGGSGVGFSEWADFAADMRHGLLEAGLGVGIAADLDAAEEELPVHGRRAP